LKFFINYFTFYQNIEGIFHAMTFDNCSGGVARMAIITKRGVERRIYYNTPNGEPVFHMEAEKF